MKRAPGFVVMILASLIFSPGAAPANESIPRREALVHWVVDGDTFETETGERIRLIGIDTPEYQPWKGRIDAYGREASDYSKKMLGGKRVWLESDLETRDRYGRTLAYVFLKDGTFVNEKLVAEGMARAKAYGHLNRRYTARLADVQKEAKRLKKGLWSEKTARQGARLLD